MQTQLNKRYVGVQEKHIESKVGTLCLHSIRLVLCPVSRFQVLKSETKEKERRNSKPYQFSPTLLQQSLPPRSSWSNLSKANLLVSVSTCVRQGVMPLRCFFMDELGSPLPGAWSEDTCSTQLLRTCLSYRLIPPQMPPSYYPHPLGAYTQSC